MIQAQVLSVNFVEFLRTLFLTKSLVAASEDEPDETKLLHMIFRMNKCYLWMIPYELFWQPVKMDT